MLCTIPSVVVCDDVLDIGKPVLVCSDFLQHQVEVSMQLAASGLDTVDVVPVPGDELDDEFVGDKIFPKSSRGRLASLD